MSTVNSEKNQLTPDSFERLLGWLAADRELAGRRYEEIRVKLIKLFIYRGCANAEELTDITINRVCRKLGEIIDNYVGEPMLYFASVARLVFLEHQRKPQLLPLDPLVTPMADKGSAPIDLDNSEPEHQCLQRCMERLTPANRQLILAYYQEEKQAKIDHRKELAEKIGININALRIRATRIRAELETCIRDCLTINSTK